jgi:uncharacterized protein (TIGR02444 family)
VAELISPSGTGPGTPGPAPSLWTFSLEVYGKPGVAEACLFLQARHGADVNLLLWAAFLGARCNHALTLEERRQAEESVAEWHDEIVRSLRALRTRLKSGPGPAPSPGSEKLRSGIKALELEAERLEQEELQKLCLWPEAAGTAQQAFANLRLFLSGQVSAEDEAAMKTIASAATLSTPTKDVR